MWYEGYNFSQTTKDQLLENSDYRCTICGCRPTNHNPLTLHHHHIWKYEARLFRLPRQYVACEANGLVVCQLDHVELHRHQHLRKADDVIAGIGIIGQAIQSLDTEFWQERVYSRRRLLHRLALRS